MSRQFDRKINLIIGDRRFQFPRYEIEFRANFDTDPEPNDAEITIYNLSEQTLVPMRKNTPVIINAGYGRDVGSVFLGSIEEVKGSWSGVDKLVNITVGDGSDRWLKQTINKAYRPGTSAVAIIRDMLNMFGLEIGQIQLKENKVYSGGRTISGNLETVLRQIVVKDCKSKLFISNGTIFIRPGEQGKETAFILNSNTGLIETPQTMETEEGVIKYSVYALMNHRITADSLLRIESRTARGLFRVVKGYHTANYSDFMTYMEVVQA